MIVESSQCCNVDAVGFYYEDGKRKVTLMANELVPNRLIEQYQTVLDRPAYQLDNDRIVTVTPRVVTMLTEQGVRLSHKVPLDSHWLRQAVVAEMVDHWGDKQ